MMMLLLTQPRKLLGLLCHENTLLAHVPLLHQESQILLCKAPFQPAVPSMYWCKRLFQPRCRTWHFALIPFHKVPVSLFLQPMNTSLNGSTILWRIIHSSEFCIICKLAKCNSVPPLRSRTKMLNDIGHSTDLEVHR